MGWNANIDWENPYLVPWSLALHDIVSAVNERSSVIGLADIKAGGVTIDPDNIGLNNLDQVVASIDFRIQNELLKSTYITVGSKSWWWYDYNVAVAGKFSGSSQLWDKTMSGAEMLAYIYPDPADRDYIYSASLATKQNALGTRHRDWIYQTYSLLNMMKWAAPWGTNSGGGGSVPFNAQTSEEYRQSSASVASWNASSWSSGYSPTYGRGHYATDNYGFGHRWGRGAEKPYLSRVVGDTFSADIDFYYNEVRAKDNVFLDGDGLGIAVGEILNYETVSGTTASTVISGSIGRIDTPPDFGSTSSSDERGYDTNYVSTPNFWTVAKYDVVGGFEYID